MSFEKSVKRQDDIIANGQALLDDYVLDDALDDQPTETDKVNAQNALIAKLAKMPLLEYDQARHEAAKELGCRPSILDMIIKTARAELDDSDDSQMLSIADPEPWPKPVDGAALADTIAQTLAKYIALPDGAADAVAIWILHTYCLDSVFVSPFLTLSSPEKRCGKTTLLTLVSALSRRPMMSSNITPAALFRAIEKFKPSLMIDEADCFIRDNDELRGVLNSGHTRVSAFVVRTTGDNHDPAQFSTWAAKCIALIGKLPDTLADRSVIIPMRRRLPGESVDKLRLDKLDDLNPLARQCLRWSQDNQHTVKASDPELPSGLHDRAADNWRTLFMVADAIGGEWPSRLKVAVNHLVEIDTDDESIGAELLNDIKAVFDSKRVNRIFTVDLLEALCDDDEAPWSTWNRGKPMSSRQLAKRLKEFGIVTNQTIRIGNLRGKGYEHEQFNDAFARYTPSVIGDKVTTLEPSGIQQNPIGDKRKIVTDRKTLERRSDAGCHLVTDKNPQTDEVSL